MPFSFVLPKTGQRPQASVDLSLNPKNLQQRDLRVLGFEFSDTQFNPDYTFELGGWSVATRLLPIRIATMKLAGIGLVSAFLAVNSNTGLASARSLAFCAAVCGIAAYHYRIIWKVRKQVYGGRKYSRLTAEVGGEEEELVGGQDGREKAALLFQENTVDQLRCSDWVCTLVLMSLEIGGMRQYMFEASAGAIPLPPVKKEWAALSQAAMIGFYIVYRFWCNEARPFYDPETKTYRSPRLCTVVLAALSFLASTGLFFVALLGGLGGLPSTDAVSHPSLKAEILCLQLLCLNWTGYPLVVLAARIGHIGELGGYSGTWSFIKDSSFAVLDVISKGGLALVVVLRVCWLTAAEEDGMVAAGKLALGLR